MAYVPNTNCYCYLDAFGIEDETTFERSKAIKTYRSISLRIHSDKCDHPLAGPAQALLNSAWEVLKDDDLREKYFRSGLRELANQHDCEEAQELIGFIVQRTQTPPEPTKRKQPDTPPPSPPRKVQAKEEPTWDGQMTEIIDHQVRLGKLIFIVRRNTKEPVTSREKQATMLEERNIHLLRKYLDQLADSPRQTRISNIIKNFNELYRTVYQK